MISIRYLLAGGCALALAGCIAVSSEDEDDVVALVSNLTPEERRVRAGLIRDAADEVGLYNGLIIAGVANAETGMSQCWSELTWACQGPYSADCDGPVVAGAGDGPCELEQGGLGMFQFDAGTYAQTLEREGDRVLLIDGNVQAGIDFIIGMVKRSMYIPDVATDEEAIAWLNAVRPWNAHWTPWIQTVVRYYNGCIPGVCGAYEARYENYGTKSITLLTELGAAFWYGAGAGCGPIPAEGGTIDDTDLCFGAGGNPAYWRDEAAGFDGSLVWTNATAATAPSNYAIWTLRFTAPGDYLVEAYTDTAFAESMRAAYGVSHDGTVSVATIDQSAADGFAPLGVFHFAANGDEHVRLDDDTGEPGSGLTALVADALRVTPVANVPDGGVDGGIGTDGGVMPDGEVDAGAMPSHGGGCSTTARRQSSTELAFVGVLALACVLRRRVTPRVQRARSAR